VWNVHFRRSRSWIWTYLSGFVRLLTSLILSSCNYCIRFTFQKKDIESELRYEFDWNRYTSTLSDVYSSSSTCMRIKRFIQFGWFFNEVQYFPFWILKIYVCTVMLPAGFCLRLQVKPTQLGPVDRASPCLRTPAPTQDTVYKWSTAQPVCESQDKALKKLHTYEA
jgi:hypothetical protein